MFAAISIASLVVWVLLAAFHVSAVEMHVLLLATVVAYLIHIARSQNRGEHFLVSLRNRTSLQDARSARKRASQRLREVEDNRRAPSTPDPEAFEQWDTDRWHVPDASNGFVRARGSRMTETDTAMRDAILNLLSNEEVASVSTPSTARCLSVGEEFLDLEHVELGVRRASGVGPPSGYVLPRTGVSDETWLQILQHLEPANT